jgi:hypothetical protein
VVGTKRAKPTVRDVWLTVAEDRMVRVVMQWDGSDGLFSVHDLLNAVYRYDFDVYVDANFAQLMLVRFFRKKEDGWSAVRVRAIPQQASIRCSASSIKRVQTPVTDSAGLVDFLNWAKSTSSERSGNSVRLVVYDEILKVLTNLLKGQVSCISDMDV